MSRVPPISLCSFASIAAALVIAACGGRERKPATATYLKGQLHAHTDNSGDILVYGVATDDAHHYDDAEQVRSSATSAT